jgi:C-terminal processing protease CtpA/Prc
MAAYYNTNGLPLEGNGVEPDIKMNYYDPDHYNSADDLIYEYAVHYITGQKLAVKNFKADIVPHSKFYKQSGLPEVIEKAIRNCQYGKI